MARPVASVIVAARNASLLLPECIAALKKQKTRISYEVHVVDAASSDRTYGEAKKLTAGLKNFFVWKCKRPGLAAAKNFGAKRARGRILLFTDVEAIASPKWVEELARPLLEPAAYPLAATAGSTERKETENLWFHYLQRLHDFWEKDQTGNHPAFLPWAPGWNMAVKTQHFYQLKGFDEALSLYAYDMDFCWRLLLCGFTLGQAPKARIDLRFRSTLRSLVRLMENYAYFYQSLLSIYQSELKLSSMGIKERRLLGQSRRLVSLLRSTTNLKEISLRGVDSLVQVATLKGALEAKFMGVKADPRHSATRKGEVPDELKRELPRGYSHLHREGWACWRDPADLSAKEAGLILYRPRQGQRFRFSDSAWKVWEIKAENGQSEDAAEALGHAPNDAEALHEIDQLTLDFRTRRLLPPAGRERSK